MSLIFTIKVVPSSGRQECIQEITGGIKCYLKSQPEKGKANQELVDFLAKKLGIPKYKVAVIGGLTTRNKRVACDVVLTEEQVISLLCG